MLYTSGREYVASLQLEGGFSLPESFQRFATEMGYGTLGGDLVIDVPFERNADRCPALTATLPGSRAALLSALEFVEPEEHALYRRLLPFGRAGYGPQLCWDPEESTGPGGEVAIYVAWDNTAWRAGNSFDDMIDRLTRKEGIRPFGRAYPRSFDPYARCQAIHVDLGTPRGGLEERLEALIGAMAPARRSVRFDVNERIEQRVELDVPPVDGAVLARVGVPEQFHSSVLAAPTREALLDVSGVPDEWLLRLHDDVRHHPTRATLSYTEWRTTETPRHSLCLSTTPRHEAECLRRLRRLLALGGFSPRRVYDIAGNDTWGLMAVG